MPVFVRTAAVLAALILTVAPAAAHDTGPRVPTLTLSATGSVTAPPDTAVVTLGVVTEAETAGPALTENNEKMRALIDAFMTAGVADRDIGTSGFGVEPVMVYPGVKDDGTQDRPRISGYRVSNNVTVRIREIAMAGKLLDQVVGIGANQVQGIAFTVQNDEALLDRARKEAMRKAVAKADVYAEAGSFRLGRLVSVREGVDAPAFRVDPSMGRAAMESVPLAPGEQEISVTVELEWEIVQRK